MDDVKRFFILVVMAFFGLFSKQAGATPERDFWAWFQRNEPVLFDFEKNQDKVFASLASALHKVHPSLTFEFGPKQNGRREPLGSEYFFPTASLK